MSVFSDLLALLDSWDRQAFLQVNITWSNAFCDSVFPWWRERNTWIPFYIIMLAVMLYKFGWRCWPWILMAAAAPALGDLISSWGIKYWTNRTRPCSEPALVGLVHLRASYCPGNGSFTSSHAVNHFALGTFFYATLKTYIKGWAWLFVIWAASIAFAQVYVGVHYPGDVLAGALIGAGIGGGLAAVFNSKVGLPFRQNKR